MLFAKRLYYQSLLLSSSIFISSLFFPAVARPTFVRGSLQAEGVRIDLPANGQLRIENRFGSIAVEVWKERNVSVAVAFEGSAALDHSPVMIETRNDLLSVSVVRNSTDPPVGIDLTLRLPENARAEIITNEGKITSRGLSTSISLNTVSGNILAELVAPFDADVIARSTEGSVRSDLNGAGNGDGHNFRSRLGTGKRIFRANSQRGEIVLTSSSPALAEQRAPQLRGSPQRSSGAGTPANQAPTEEVGEGDVVRVDAQLVALNLSVVDRGTNKGIMGLDQSHFRLFEDGIEQRILHFDSASAPFDLVLLIDLSGSTRDVVKLIRVAARHFVDAARPADRIAIITFAGKPNVVSPLTLDRNALRKSIDAIDTLPGDTKLYDATDFAMAEVTREMTKSRRAAVVLMSDGLDGTVPGVHGQQGSKISYKELLNTVREFDGVLYTLWLDTYYEALNPEDTAEEAFDMGYDRMKELADAGGGMFYEVERLDDLAGVYERVVADLGTVYSLAYRPSNKIRDGKWRAVRVAIDRPNAIARGKHGYYAN
jgi:VWFA-related protein